MTTLLFSGGQRVWVSPGPRDDLGGPGSCVVTAAELSSPYDLPGADPRALPASVGSEHLQDTRCAMEGRFLLGVNWAR